MFTESEEKRMHKVLQLHIPMSIFVALIFEKCQTLKMLKRPNAFSHSHVMHVYKTNEFLR